MSGSYYVAGYIDDTYFTGNDVFGEFQFVGASKLIIVQSGVTSISVRKLVSRWADWTALDDNAKFLPAFQTVGGDVVDAGAGTRIPVYAFLLNGWRIRPQEASHTLSVGDGVVLVSGGGDPFVNTLGNYVVRINYQQPVQAISFDTGGGGGGATAADVWAYGTRTITQEIPVPPTDAQIAAAVWAYVTRALTTAPSGLTPQEAAKLSELHLLHGLDPNNPLTVGANQRLAGPILQNISTVGDVTTVERQ